VKRERFEQESGRMGRWARRMCGFVSCFVLLAVPSAAQQDSPCAFLCAPKLKIEPTWTVENLTKRPQVEIDGQVEQVPRETVFELIVALEVPTEIPRVGFTLEAIFLPFGGTAVHPFTGGTAGELGRDEIRDNGIEIEAEVNFDVLEAGQTGGWVSSHVDIVDKFSPGATPRAASVYTHKLNFEWDTAFHVFHRVPAGQWLQDIEAEVSLDYVATGLAQAGDIIGGERLLGDVSPWSLSFVFAFPLAPLAP